MAWKKAPESLVALFATLVPRGVERRPMFGYPAAFVGGHMAFGLFEDQLVMRVSEPDVHELRNLGARPFEPMPGRSMAGWVSVPPQVLDDGPELKRWVLRALTWAASLPPKPQATRARAAPGRSAPRTVKKPVAKKKPAAKRPARRAK